MNAAQFQTWVKQGPTASDVSALRALVARYPYSGVLRLWLAKASHMAEDLNRNEDLLAAGAHVPSRRALFQALMGPALVEAAQHIHQEVLAAPEVSEEELRIAVAEARELLREATRIAGEQSRLELSMQFSVRAVEILSTQARAPGSCR